PDFALYSRLVEDYEGINFMLQALPEEYETLIVPIGLDAKAGEIITFSAESVNIPEDYAVVLEDRAMNVFTDLSDEGEYAVQLADDSEGVGRFFVHTSFKSALGIGDLDAENAFQVFTRVNDNQLVIRGESTTNTVARIYSITGKQIAVVNLDNATEQSVSFNEESGVYIVQISNEQGTYTQKFSWVK
ncbi:MAG: T9SS type A sorting domain-containing protein, partial [Bacteroidales bacterium]|nr:T9SS type A sorting domain-containing protein [Bacteroidales bacterium]